MTTENSMRTATLYFQEGLGDENGCDVQDLFKKWREFELKVPIWALYISRDTPMLVDVVSYTTE